MLKHAIGLDSQAALHRVAEMAQHIRGVEARGQQLETECVGSGLQCDAQLEQLKELNKRELETTSQLTRMQRCHQVKSEMASQLQSAVDTKDQEIANLQAELKAR